MIKSITSRPLSEYKSENITFIPPHPYKSIWKAIDVSDGIICLLSGSTNEARDNRKNILKIDYDGNIIWEVCDKMLVWQEQFPLDDIRREERLDVIRTAGFGRMYIVNEELESITLAYSDSEMTRMDVLSEGIKQSPKARIVVGDTRRGGEYFLDESDGTLELWRPFKFYNEIELNGKNGKVKMFQAPYPYLFIKNFIDINDGVICVLDGGSLSNEEMRKNVIKVDYEGNMLWRVSDKVDVWKGLLKSGRYSDPAVLKGKDSRKFIGVSMASEWDSKKFGDQGLQKDRVVLADYCEFFVDPENGQLEFWQCSK